MEFSHTGGGSVKKLITTQEGGNLKKLRNIEINGGTVSKFYAL